MSKWHSSRTPAFLFSSPCQWCSLQIPWCLMLAKISKMKGIVLERGGCFSKTSCVQFFTHKENAQVGWSGTPFLHKLQLHTTLQFQIFIKKSFTDQDKGQESDRLQKWNPRPVAGQRLSSPASIFVCFFWGGVIMKCQLNQARHQHTSCLTFACASSLRQMFCSVTFISAKKVRHSSFEHDSQCLSHFPHGKPL